MSESPLLRAEGLTRHYSVTRGFLRGSATLRAVDGVDFSLEAGRTLAVVGESGSGKSTLGRVVTMIEPPTGGRLTIADVDARTTDQDQRRRLRREVQMVFQDPYGSLNPRQTVRTIIGEPMTVNTNRDRAEVHDAVADMMGRVGLRPEHAGRYPHMFSGGQRQRIAIARALMLNPRVVVADEPVSALDVSIRAQILNLMMDLQESFKLAYLFISHDLGVVRHIADEVLVLYLGRPAEQGTKDRIFASPRHPYTRALLSATPRVEPGDRAERIVLTGELPSPLDPPTGCAFHGRCPLATDRCSAERPVLRPVDGRDVACHHAERVEH